ncbi:MAG: hypothetical protein CVU56_10455 [Deltaproteobacteria bacterium HGW-Deltaproteobacteria-14]|nr:MAG: hypothetical protein CVU56_10455 [Deltaproteobacteria bacterium HGW-Deltaproteobacteria-14]
MFLTSLGAISVGDILDVALVSVLLYALLRWFEGARAAFVVRGMIVAGAVYLIARIANMEMTTGVFHGFFAILAVALVVIFQEPLRQVFERLAVWSLSAGKIRAAPQLSLPAAVVRTIGDFARERTGALIVLRGRDPLDRHLIGGWPLGGKLSEPLLKSIFDHHSVGHDGAVIVQDQQVTHFGCRLPLSRGFDPTECHGTRHAAALGLAELTDALCIVVSEERGTVSVARNGKLEKLADLAALEVILKAFADEIRPAAPGDRLRRLRTHHPRQKLLAFGSALLLWAVFVYADKVVEHDFELPVAVVNVPAETVADVEPDVVRVRVSATIGDFLWADSDTMVVQADLAGATGGPIRARLELRPDSVPASFVVKGLDPILVEVQLSPQPAGSP